MVGVMLRDTLQSQCNFSVINAVNYINQTSISVASMFSLVMTPSCVRPMCCHTTLDKIWGFKGSLIATDVETARFLLRHNSHDKNWYVWDLEWLRNRYLIDDMKGLYGSKRFSITCRSDDHAKALMEFTGRDDILVQNNFTKYMIEKVNNATKRNN